MGFIAELFTGILDVLKDVLSALLGIIPKVISFLLWILSGIIILPCVFIAGTLYPKWVDWGEKGF